ncbi:hypothetical protein M0657_008974 [Pyricularia oryzae]|nr:hypothetical protein M0657_008974 [Pyricularia oryzae]KAI7916719.1 hypothetical protein M9X92_007768 [Pyricularia oryzae]
MAGCPLCTELAQLLNTPINKPHKWKQLELDHPAFHSCPAHEHVLRAGLVTPDDIRSIYPGVLPWLEKDARRPFVRFHRRCLDVVAQEGHWGIVDGGGGPGSNYLSTNEENISVLSQPGALFERHDGTPAELPAPALASQKLPKTWRDAIHLTRLLGFRYLWVDLTYGGCRLCSTSEGTLKRPPSGRKTQAMGQPNLDVQRRVPVLTKNARVRRRHATSNTCRKAVRTSATSGTGAACRRGGCGTPSPGGNGGTEGWQNLEFDARIADDHFTIRWHDCEISPLVLDWATGNRCNMAPSDRRPVRFYRDWAELRDGYRGKQKTAAAKATYLRPRFLFGTIDVSSTGFHVRQGDQPGVTAAETKWANEMSRNKTSFPLFDQAGRISGIIKPNDHLMEACEFGPGRAQGHQIFEEIKTFPSYGNDIPPEIEINRKPYEYYNVLWLGRWREEKVSGLESGWASGECLVRGGCRQSRKRVR